MYRRYRNYRPSVYIDNVLLLVHYVLFLYLVLFVSLRTNELIEVKEIPVAGKVHELGQTDGTSIGGARRLRNRDLELCSPRGFGGMEYHAWLPERRPLLLGELGIVRSSRRASCSLSSSLSDFSSYSTLPYPFCPKSTLSIFSFLYIFSAVSVFPISPLVSASDHLRFFPALTDSSRVSFSLSLSFSELAERSAA